MSTTKNIQMQIYNGTDYDILYPKTNVDLVDGLNDKFSNYYKKTEILSSATKTLYGLGSSATPNDIF